MDVGTPTVVFGAASGIGRGIAETFVARGASVFLADLSDERLRLTAKGLADGPGRVVGSALCDVSDPASVRDAVDRAETALDGLSAMVNAAGITTFAPFTEIAPEDWRRVLDVNLTGAFYCSQAAARKMLAGDGGAIVNIASQAAYRGQPSNAHYGAAKAGLLHLTRTMARELAPTIRVNAVCPGEVETPMMDTTFSYFAEREGVDPARQKQELRASIPLGRFQTPASIGGVVWFLCSTAAADITGQSVIVDGGILA
jgi:meso-butanediol dehydrogenase/(S,S)-butanediol dehydrogenase/diacetyl reductase